MNSLPTARTSRLLKKTIHMNTKIIEFEKISIIIIAVLILILAVARLYSYEYFMYSIWSDRDLTRAQNLTSFFEIYGSELSGGRGARGLGAAQSYISFVLMKVSESPLFIYFSLLSASLLGGILLFDIGRRAYNKQAGLISLAVYLSSSVFIGVTREIWNPHFGLIFGVVGYYFFLRFILDRRKIFFILFILFIFVSAQMHASYFIVAAFFIFYSIFYIRGIGTATFGLAALIVAWLYSPWILNELFGLFPQNVIPVFPEQTQPIPTTDWSIVFRALMNSLSTMSSLGEARGITIPLHLPFGAIFLGILGCKFANTNPVNGKHGGNQVRNIIIILSLCVAVGIFFVAMHGEYRMVSETPRYYSFLLPATALISGLGTAIIYEHSTKNRSLIFKGVYLLIISLVIIRLLLPTYRTIKGYSLDGDYLGQTFGTLEKTSYKPTLDVLIDVNRQFGFDAKDIRNRVAVIAKITQASHYQRSLNNQYFRFAMLPFEYALRHQNLPKTEKYDGCVVVVSKEIAYGEYNISEDDALKEMYLILNNGRPFNVDEIISRKRYIMVGARPPAGGCPKSFTNDYAFDDIELFIEESLKDIRNGTRIISNRKNNASVLYKTSETGTPYPVNILFNIEYRNGQASVLVNSKQLRNHATILNGFWNVTTLVSPVAKFRNLETNISFKIKLHPDEIGINGSRTPWKSPSISFPPGTYEVSFHADYVGPKRENIDALPFEQILISEFVVE